METSVALASTSTVPPSLAMATCQYIAVSLILQAIPTPYPYSPSNVQTINLEPAKTPGQALNNCRVVR